MNLKPYLTQKLLKMDYRSKYKAKTIKILKEKKMGENLSKLGVGTELLDRTQITNHKRKKKDKPDKI